MKIAVFDTHPYDQAALETANTRFKHTLNYFEARLNAGTAPLAQGFDAVCPFVNCRLDADTLAQLAKGGTRLVTLRAAGFNGIDLAAAKACDITVTRVPAYSPHAVAEHTFALLLTLVRKTHRAFNRVREADFSLAGLVGFDLHGKTFGIVGTGKIGRVAARIAAGFGCRVLLADPYPDTAFATEIRATYSPLDTLFGEADIVSLHLPLSPQSHHLINTASLARMKPGAILVNTSRGGLIDTPALIQALKSGQLGGVALDVYELEEGVFFEDLSSSGIADDQLARLITLPNVLITSHQGFLTREALANIANTTLDNARAFDAGESLKNAVV
ncbi:2-hydroxyacid dehydrogenase [Chitinimonas sp. BJB300]|uniref:2-hydroxyacid dehydrogenase n=1 Tax=Chitinimonas sp. BJB300 TaxID=1559339 RepID=UPI000C0E7B4A|nr:2-hydroxyacid dehydrogenase [Chitinimonas sp. BJB300]PHV12198.1 hydroxyacid dehydrogenase [Chitinimonas sp. BJB300]TSJ91603.1 2-hydroxyacid dehydrogenase [Chitinimonas sp. BJB300]